MAYDIVRLTYEFAFIEATDFDEVGVDENDIAIGIGLRRQDHVVANVEFDCSHGKILAHGSFLMHQY